MRTNLSQLDLLLIEQGLDERKDNIIRKAIMEDEVQDKDALEELRQVMELKDRIHRLWVRTHQTESP